MQPDLDPHVLAAAAAVGLLEVHPFPEGNGRLSRILVNWALARSGLPFVITLCASAAQRTLYQASSVAACVDSPGAPTLAPMVALISTAVARAWVDVEHLKPADAAAESTALARARDAAKAQPCMVCLDESPDIAALCCGATVHMSCLTDWLARGATASCVQCR